MLYKKFIFPALFLCYSASSLAVVDLSTMYCPNKKMDDIVTCGMAAWPSLTATPWLKDEWILSHKYSVNTKSIVGSKGGFVYADISPLKDKSDSLAQTISSYKKSFLKNYPKGSFSYVHSLKTKDGNSFLIFKLDSGEDRKPVGYVSFMEADLKIAGATESIAKIKQKAIYILGLKIFEKDEVTVQFEKFKEYIEQFSINTPSENADKKIIDEIGKLFEQDASSCGSPGKMDEV